MTPHILRYGVQILCISGCSISARGHVSLCNSVTVKLYIQIGSAILYSEGG